MLDSNTSNNKRRTFIAGAVCPKCGARDRMVIYTSGDVRRCIDCGFSDTRPEFPSELPATRFARPAPSPQPVEAEPVRFVVEPVAE